MTDNATAPPPELRPAGPTRISVVERVGGGVHGPQGLRLADARGPAGARLYRRFDRLSMSAPATKPGRLLLRTGRSERASVIDCAWEPTERGGFLFTAEAPQIKGSAPTETLDGWVRKRPGVPGSWDLDLIFTASGDARITLARVSAVCTVPVADEEPGTPFEPAGADAPDPEDGEQAYGIKVPAEYDLTIRPAIDGSELPELPGLLSFLHLPERGGLPWPPFLLIGSGDLRHGSPAWGVTDVNDADVTVHGNDLHARRGHEHTEGMPPSWGMEAPGLGGLSLVLPYQAMTGTADITVGADSVTGSVSLAGVPGGHTYRADFTGVPHRDETVVPEKMPAESATGPDTEPDLPWLDLLCSEFDLILHCTEGFPGSPCVPALLLVYPADLGARTFQFSLTTVGTPVGPGYIGWSLAGLNTAVHISGSTLAIAGRAGPDWNMDEGKLPEAAQAVLELHHDTGSHAVTGWLSMTDTAGRVFRAAIEGRWRGADAAALRRVLAIPRLDGSWRGALGPRSRMVITQAREGRWRPFNVTQNDPVFLRHAIGPDLAIGLDADGGLIVLERDGPPDPAEAQVTDARALRTLGQRLSHENRYAEALRLLDRAADRYAAQATVAEAARSDLISAGASVAERAFCALALSDYPGLLRCLADGIACRRRLIGLAPRMSDDVLDGARQLPGSLESWRLRLDEDADRIDSVSAGTPFYGLLALFMLDHGAVEDALVASELGRARAFADMLAAPGGELDRGSAPRFSRKILREILAEQRRAVVEYFVTGEGLLIWVIDPAGEIHYVPGPADAGPRLAAAAGRYREVMTAVRLDQGALDSVLRDLYDILWHPVAALLPSAPDETVLVVPHGPAMQVPFPGLRAANGQYLVERHAVVLLPGLALLPMLRERQAARSVQPDRLLAFVGPDPMPINPDTGEPLSSVAVMGQLFDAIAGLYPDVTVHAGRNASAAALLAAGAATAAPHPAVLHLGTHAFVSEQEGADPLDSFIALACTGGGTPGADGRLRALDIVGRVIPGDCAVLAACTTGRGTITGDGVVGLSRAFLTAGPTTLVLSLSEVDRDSSMELMYRFHASLRGSAFPALALARAQRALLAEGEQAANWSSFVLFGAPAPEANGGSEQG